MHSPKNMAEPQIIPTPPTASGRTNILEPTVFPVMSSAADDTLVMASISTLLFNCGNSEARSASLGKLSTPSSVATDSEVIFALSLELYGICCDTDSYRRSLSIEEDDFISRTVVL